MLGYGDYADYHHRLIDLVDQGTHFVRWGHVKPGQPGLTRRYDNVAGGQAATAHLIERGRRRIAFLGDATDHYPEFHDRYGGYAQALAAADMSPDPALQVSSISTEEDGVRAARELLDRGVAFDGIVAASNLIALAAMHVLAGVGVTVPGEVAIVGFDDIPAASLAHPPLTTVVQDAGTAGRRLVELLLARIKGEAVASLVLPTRLTVRRSSGEISAAA